MASSKASRAARRGAKKFFKNLHAATKVTLVLALLVGLAAGAFACITVSKNDRFLLAGSSAVSIDVSRDGTPFLYAEEGVEAVCFGRDVSDKLTVDTQLQRDAEGRYIIPTDKEGIYTITYTVDCVKFGERAPNGVIKRIRTFTVTATEEDGRYGEAE